MQPTAVEVIVMDSARPGELVSLQVEQLSPGRRASRAGKRLLLVSGIGLALVPVPLIHLCGAAMALIGGPVAAAFAWRPTVLIGQGSVPCAKCSEVVNTPAGLSGWPARVHCPKCGAMLELRPARSATSLPNS